MKKSTKNKDSKDKKVGWNDWQVLVSMLLFATLWLIYICFDIKIFFYIGFIPMTYGILRCIAM